MQRPPPAHSWRLRALCSVSPSSAPGSSARYRPLPSTRAFGRQRYDGADNTGPRAQLAPSPTAKTKVLLRATCHPQNLLTSNGQARFVLTDLSHTQRSANVFPARSFRPGRVLPESCSAHIINPFETEACPFHSNGASCNRDSRETASASSESPSTPTPDAEMSCVPGPSTTTQRPLSAARCNPVHSRHHRRHHLHAASC